MGTYQYLGPREERPLREEMFAYGVVEGTLTKDLKSITIATTISIGLIDDCGKKRGWVIY